MPIRFGKLLVDATCEFGLRFREMVKEPMLLGDTEALDTGSQVWCVADPAGVDGSVRRLMHERAGTPCDPIFRIGLVLAFVKVDNTTPRAVPISSMPRPFERC